MSQINDYVTSQLQPGETVVFENGIRAAYDGTTLRVASKPLKSLNAVLDPDGTVHRGGFIRTFQ